MINLPNTIVRETDLVDVPDAAPPLNDRLPGGARKTGQAVNDRCHEEG
jgi:hypothetical protein